MKIGSRPIARIARTGELTPPGITSSARRYSSPERVSVSDAVTDGLSSVLALPALEVLGEVQEADLLELHRRVERRTSHLPQRRGHGGQHLVEHILGVPLRQSEHRVGVELH